MEDVYNQFFALIGQLVIAAGGATAVAIALFVFLGRGIIEGYFQKRVESHKSALSAQQEALRHQNASELAKMRSEIEIYLDNALRMQKLEFDIYAKCWELLDEALSRTRAFISGASFSPDLETMTVDERRRFLNNASLSESQISQIESSKDKNVSAYRIFKLNEGEIVLKSIYAYKNHFSKNLIFIDDDTENELEQIFQKLISSANSKYVSEQIVAGRLGENAWKELRSSLEPLVASFKLKTREKFQAIRHKSNSHMERQ